MDPDDVDDKVPTEEIEDETSFPLDDTSFVDDGNVNNKSDYIALSDDESFGATLNRFVD